MANPFDILKQLQGLQSRVGEMQEKLKSVHVSGSSGGGMVTIEMNGQMTVEKVTIAKEAVDPADIPMLEDLVLAALTAVLDRLKDKLKDEVSQATGGLGLPPGMLGM
ncbi:MAG: YbaB/EbfC family nucleoid-associated protein [Spirochaetes bacterium]|nr:YbaB/EbfC family nucleoid-associated protein [Spirochaetota bacterium]